jgi:hypothetical protein
MKKYETPNIVGMLVETEVSFVASSHFVQRKNPCKDCTHYGEDICKECLYREERNYFRP